MADRKEEIIRASTKIFAAKGYYNTHIADIVGEVGIAKGTFYLYFNSKKDLFISLINRFDQIFLHAFDNERFAAADKNLQYFFYRLLKSLFLLYQKHEDLSIIISREAVAVNKEFAQEFKEMDHKRFERLKLLFNFLKDNGYLNSDINFDYFAVTFIGILESIVLRRLVLTQKKFDIEEAALTISKYLTKAICK